MFYPTGLQGFPFNQTVVRRLGNTFQSQSVLSWDITALRSLSLILVAYLAWRWFLTAELQVSTQDVLFDILVWRSRKGSNQISFCSGQSQFFYNQYHLVRLAFSGPQGGDLIGRVLVIGPMPRAALEAFLRQTSKDCPFVPSYRLAQSNGSFCYWALTRSSNSCVVFGEANGTQPHIRLISELKSFTAQEPLYRALGLPYSRVIFLHSNHEYIDSVVLSAAQAICHMLYTIEVDFEEELLPRHTDLQRASWDIPGGSLVHIKLTTSDRILNQPAMPPDTLKGILRLINKLRSLHGALVLISSPHPFEALMLSCDLAVGLAEGDVSAVPPLTRSAMGSATTDELVIALQTRLGKEIPTMRGLQSLLLRFHNRPTDLLDHIVQREPSIF